ncbi:nucleotidyltransferase domain-containing protein [Endozoicomonas sp. ALD040]|uniref:nucleotidyltransferase domain-containing protein n=1 Tax=Endozoicomonas sp. ALD040 TaxID=3403079 RepID=UPI003BAFCB41
MRITSEHAGHICNVLQHYFGAKTDIWLFGSRVDDNQRGGDIDLYIETDLQSPEAVFDAKLHSLVDIKQHIGDQKIDLVIYRRGKHREAIHHEARNTGIQLSGSRAG